LRGLAGQLSTRDAAMAAQTLDGLVRSWEAARVELLDAMRSGRYAALLDRLVAATHRPALLAAADAPASEVLPPLVDRPWRRLRKDVRSLAEVPQDQELHAIRIRAKRCRYAAEAVVPALGKPARDFAKAVAALQDVLGDHQDAVVASAWLREATVGAPADEVFVAGMMAGMLRRIERETRAAWPKAWREVRRKRLHRPQ
jgi:CHAD domain-containing protein